MISAGRCVFSMTLAIVKVLPEPVMPRRVCTRILQTAWRLSRDEIQNYPGVEEMWRSPEDARDAI
jgi:hypothetical protein